MDKIKTLYHFSQHDFEIIKIDYFGQNSYSKNEAKYPTNRFFCYDTECPQEKGHNWSYRYQIAIPEDEIYNLDDDVLQLKEKHNIFNLLQYLSKNYTACCYTHSFKCYVVFKNIKPVKKEKINDY